MEKLTKIQIIDETVEYYKTHDRAIDDNLKCCYLSDDNRMCAHSRCLTDEARATLLQEFSNNATAYVVIGEFGDECHKEEYRGHDEEFWQRIQSIHDSHSYWSGKTFTPAGEKFVNSLKEDYANNENISF